MLQRLYGGFISRWRRARAKKRLFIYMCVYTLAFLAAFSIAWSPFLLDGKTFIWFYDGRFQHYPLFVYVGRTLRRLLTGFLGGNFTVPQFDISMGAGDDVFNFVNSLGGTDPLLWLAALAPLGYSEHLFAFLAIFRIWLAGLSFSYLCLYFGKRAVHTLIGSMVYCFCAYSMICSMRHPYFITPMFLLPLLIVGADKILRKENPLLFILTVFYTVLCGYYHLYMMSLMVLFYSSVRFFDLYAEKRGGEFFRGLARGAGDYLLGLGLGAVILVPAVMGYLGAYRTGFHNYAANASVYSWSERFVHLVKLIAPHGNWDNMSFAAIVILALTLLLFSRGRRTLKIMTVAAFAVLMTRTGGLIMNGFQYSSNRWSFGLVLVAAYATVEMLPDLLELTRARRLICFATLAVYTASCFATRFARSVDFLSVGAVFLAVTFSALTAFPRKADENAVNAGRAAAVDRYREALCLLVVIFNVGVNGIYTFAADRWGYSREFQEMGYESARMERAPERALEPYLAENPAGRADGTDFFVNKSMVWRIPTMLAYSSTLNGHVIEFWDKIENCGRIQNHCVYSTDQRTIVNTLLSGRYHVETPETVAYVPFGYSKVKNPKSANMVYENDYSRPWSYTYAYPEKAAERTIEVYENGDALPWGYTYDTAIAYEALDRLNGSQRQEAMLQAIALDGGTVPLSGGESLTFDEKRVPYTARFENCGWKDGKLTVESPDAAITLNFELPAGVEGYLRLRGLDIDGSGTDEFNVWVECGGVQKNARVTSSLYMWHYGAENYLFNLGYSEKQRGELTVTFDRPRTFKAFPAPLTFNLQDIELYALPMTNYPARVEALRAEPLKNIQWGTNSLSGSVDLSKDKILCVSVPYSKGWSAAVDGQEAEILRGNYMFMALPLKAGHHDIVFSYCPPGLKLGLILTALSWAFFIAMLVRDKRKVGRE